MMEMVIITGGKWKSKIGIIDSWIKGLHYQRVMSDGEYLDITINWISRIMKPI